MLKKPLVFFLNLVKEPGSRHDEKKETWGDICKERKKSGWCHIYRALPKTLLYSNLSEWNKGIFGAKSFSQCKKLKNWEVYQ